MTTPPVSLFGGDAGGISSLPGASPSLARQGRVCDHCSPEQLDRLPHRLPAAAARGLTATMVVTSSERYHLPQPRALLPKRARSPRSQNVAVLDWERMPPIWGTITT